MKNALYKLVKRQAEQENWPLSNYSVTAVLSSSKKTELVDEFE